MRCKSFVRARQFPILRMKALPDRGVGRNGALESLLVLAEKVGFKIQIIGGGYPVPVASKRGKRR